jgi:hypothetical protein
LAHARLDGDENDTYTLKAMETTPMPSDKTTIRPSTSAEGSVAEKFLKLSFILIFCLYALGFLIWNIHLSKSGTFLNEFFQIDFLTAAICFLSLLLGLYLVVRVMCKLIETRWDPEHKGFSRLEGQVMLIMVGTQSLAAYWIDSTGGHPPGVLYLYLLAPTAFAVCEIRRFKRHRFFLWWKVSLLLTPLLSILPLIVTRTLHWNFVLTSMSFALLASDTVQGFLAKNTNPNTWGVNFSQGYTILLFVSALACFGRFQFDKIPRTVGGGASHTAILILGEEALRSVYSWVPGLDTNRSDSGPVPSIKGVLVGNRLGPVNILFKSREDVLFTLPGLTNEVFSIRSDLLHVIRYLKKTELRLQYQHTNNPPERKLSAELTRTLTNAAPK